MSKAVAMSSRPAAISLEANGGPAKRKTALPAPESTQHEAKKPKDKSEKAAMETAQLPADPDATQMPGTQELPRTPELCPSATVEQAAEQQVPQDTGALVTGAKSTTGPATTAVGMQARRTGMGELRKPQSAETSPQLRTEPAAATNSDLAVPPHRAERTETAEHALNLATASMGSHAAHGGQVSGPSLALTKETKAPPQIPLPGSGRSPESHPDTKTFVATPNVLEVGIADGAHGWLRVRAEVGQSGEVAATVIAASASAADGLHKELPAISAYLAGEQVGVSTLVVSAAAAGAEAQNATFGAPAGDDGRQPSNDRSQRASRSSSSSGSEERAPFVDFQVPFAPGNIAPAVFAGGLGGWVSVRV